MLISIWLEGTDTPEGILLEDPNALEDADPFAPVIRMDNVGRAAEIHLSNKRKKIGFFLRPREHLSYRTVL